MSKTSNTLEFSAFLSFEDASKAVLNHLHETLGFDLWMTTRTNEPDWIVLEIIDHSYDVSSGDVFTWADSFCTQMIAGNGPNIAQDSNDIPAYLTAKIGTEIPIRAYIGAPILSENGELYGTLCAIDPKPQKINIDKELPAIQLYARLLSTLLQKELELAKQQREYELLRKEANHDSLTGLLNRKAWDQALNNEEEKFKRYGSPIAVYILDLDDLKIINDAKGHAAGDERLKSVAQCIKSIVRSSDIVARIGGDEFAILAIEISFKKAELLLKSLRERFAQENIKISIGYTMHNPSEIMKETVIRADENMYEEKFKNRPLSAYSN